MIGHVTHTAQRAVALQGNSNCGIELQAWATGVAQLHAPVLPDTDSEDCNFDADSFRLVHCRMNGPVPAQVWRMQVVPLLHITHAAGTAMLDLPLITMASALITRLTGCRHVLTSYGAGFRPLALGTVLAPLIMAFGRRSSQC